MSQDCFARADALHDHETKLRAIQVTDADSLCAYLKGFWEFIYNHKMFGCVYDIYDDGLQRLQRRRLPHLRQGSRRARPPEMSVSGPGGGVSSLRGWL